MTELAIAVLGGLLSLILGLVAALWTIAMREINILRKKVHDLAQTAELCRYILEHKPWEKHNEGRGAE